METENHSQVFLERLYLEMSPILVRYAMASLRDADTAEDLVQDVFKIACVKYEELAASPNPRGWLVNALKYVLRNYNREKSRYIGAICRIAAGQTVGEDTEQQLESAHIDLFDTDEFALLKRLYLERATMKEIALQDDIPLEVCKKRVQRAKQRLKKLIEK